MRGTVTVLGQQITLTDLHIPKYPKTSAALKRLPVNPYQFSRAKWYVAEYNWVPDDIVFKWCVEQFGPQPEHPDAWSRWIHRLFSYEIQFRDEKDYVLFCLRWL